MATINKANNTTSINVGSSWTGGTAPTGADIGQWESTVLGANTTALSADTTWGGLKIANPGGLVTVSGAGILTTGASGWDLSTSTRDLTWNAGFTTSASTSQSILIPSGRILTVGGAMNHNGGTITISGAGTMNVNGGTTVTVGQSVATTIDLSALTNYNASSVTTYGLATGTAAVTSTMNMSPNTGISATALNMGNTGSSVNTQGYMTLGNTSNNLYVDAITIGVKRARGSITIPVGTPTVNIMGKAGGTSQTTIILGDYNTSPGNYNPFGTMDFTNASTLNAQIATMTLGLMEEGGSVTSTTTTTGTFNIAGTGSVSATTVYLGRVNPSVSRANATLATGKGIMNVYGNTTTIDNLYLGEKSKGISADRREQAWGLLTISGGTTTVTTLFKMGEQINGMGLVPSQATANLYIYAGVLNVLCDMTCGANVGETSVSTILLNGGTLNMNGKNIGSSSATIGWTTSGGSITWQTGTLTNVGLINDTEGVTKTGAGTLSLSGVNTYVGPTKMSGGFIGLTSASNGGIGSSLGASTSAAENLVFDGGGIYYTGNNTVSTNRLFTITPNGGSFYAENNAQFTFSNTGDVAFTSTGSRTISFNGTGTTIYVYPRMGDPTGGTLTVTMSETGIRRFYANNTFTGALYVRATYRTGYFPNGGIASPQGASTSAADNLRFGYANALINYLGSGDDTDRLFVLDVDQFTNTNLKIENNGTGAFKFKNTGAITWGGDPQLSVTTLEFGGNSSFTNEFYPALSDFSATRQLGLSINGSSWNVLGTNTYTGPTVVSAGTMYADGIFSSASTFTVNAGAYLAGIGNIAGSVNVSANATFYPGSYYVGKINTGSVTFANSTSTYIGYLYGLDLSAGGTFSTGTITLNSATLTVPIVFDPTAGLVYTLMSASSIVGTFNGLANNATFLTGDSRTMRINYTATTVTLTDVTSSGNKWFLLQMRNELYNTRCGSL